jgi:hypothetical protein
MNETTAPQLIVTPVVECPVCSAWTEMPDDAIAFRCEGCATEAPLADVEPRAHALAA